MRKFFKRDIKPLEFGLMSLPTLTSDSGIDIAAPTKIVDIILKTSSDTMDTGEPYQVLNTICLLNTNK
jgi:hypothetical protein